MRPEPRATHAKWLPAKQDVPEQRFWREPLLESNLFPDALIRSAIRRMLRDRLAEEDAGSGEANHHRLLAFVAQMNSSPIALRSDAANAQHYQVSAEFFATVLGPRRKYSSGVYETGTPTLADGEEAMLRLTCERAQWRDGQDILELGCGWDG
jgi:cyclopropane-fatty-acyl-phospholipid synthase